MDLWDVFSLFGVVVGLLAFLCVRPCPHCGYLALPQHQTHICRACGQPYDAKL